MYMYNAAMDHRPLNNLDPVEYAFLFSLLLKMHRLSFFFLNIDFSPTRQPFLLALCETY